LEISIHCQNHFIDMTNFEIYTEKQLTKNLPRLGFIKGYVATIVAVVQNLKGTNGYYLEFFNAQAT
jgi:hypothetical protein